MSFYRRVFDPVMLRKLENVEAENKVMRNVIDENMAKLDALFQFQGLTVRESSPGVYEVIKDVPHTGDFLDPIPWKLGDSVTAGLWYYTEDKSLPHEAIQSGVPDDFLDRNYFDIVEGT